MGVALVKEYVTKRTIVRLYLPLILQQKAPYALYIGTRWSMVHPLDEMHGCGLNNKMCTCLHPKKTKVRLY